MDFSQMFDRNSSIVSGISEHTMRNVGESMNWNGFVISVLEFMKEFSDRRPVADMVTSVCDQDRRLIENVQKVGARIAKEGWKFYKFLYSEIRTEMEENERAESIFSLKRKKRETLFSVQAHAYAIQEMEKFMEIRMRTVTQLMNLTVDARKELDSAVIRMQSEMKSISFNYADDLQRLVGNGKILLNNR